MAGFITNFSSWLARMTRVHIAWEVNRHVTIAIITPKTALRCLVHRVRIQQSLLVGSRALDARIEEKFASLIHASAPIYTISSFVHFGYETCYILAHVQMLLHLRVKDNSVIQGRIQVDFLGGGGEFEGVDPPMVSSRDHCRKPMKQDGVVTANVSKRQLYSILSAEKYAEVWGDVLKIWLHARE